MEYLIYYNVSDIYAREGMLNTIGRISGQIYSRNHIIKVDHYQMPKCSLTDICDCLCNFLSNTPLSKEDEVYIYYWAFDVTGVWQLKKKNSLKVKLIHKTLDNLDISLGAKFGVIN